jgi:hypothetical protein
MSTSPRSRPSLRTATTWTQRALTAAALVAVLVSAGEAAAQDGRVFIDIGASVDARIPHPFFFDRDRSIAGAAANLARTETAVHVQLRWFAPLGGRVSVSLFGGPTFFRVTQGLVTTVDFSQSYPFDDASFTSASTGDRSGSALGYNVGADAGFFFSRNIGVGVLARFARASVDLVSEATGLVSIDSGGFHAGGGLRLRF